MFQWYIKNLTILKKVILLTPNQIITFKCEKLSKHYACSVTAPTYEVPSNYWWETFGIETPEVQILVIDEGFKFLKCICLWMQVVNIWLYSL